jgi:hypothetical protein
MKPRTETFFRTYGPESVESIATCLFDVIPAVRAISLAMIDGINPKTSWEFGPRLNIVCGPSGSGKTRVLEALRQRTGTVAMALPPQEQCDFNGMSFGQTVMGLSKILLDLQPERTCLLMDDVLGNLDRENTEQLFHLLRIHGKQIILTVTPHQLDGIKTSSAGMQVRLFHLALPGGGGHAARA